MPNLKTSLFALALASLAGVASDSAALAQSKATIGIAMPTKSSARWIDDGNNMVKVLKERGYGTDLQYAEDDIPNQLSQIENMVTKGAKVLVIAAIDGTTLSDVLKQAKANGITVIAYDRLIRDTPNVDYYATFDNFQVGVLQAQSIGTGARPEGRQGPVQHRAVRRFAGRQQRLLLLQRRDVGAAALHRQRQAGGGIGQKGMDKVATLRWDGATAQARMDNLLSAYYGKKRVDAVLSPYDGLSIGIISSLKGVGYGSGDQPMPVISGQDARGALDQGDPARRPVFDHLQGHPRSRQGDRRHGRCRRSAARRSRSTTPRPTTTASRWFRPICSSRWWSTRATGKRP